MLKISVIVAIVLTAFIHANDEVIERTTDTSMDIMFGAAPSEVLTGGLMKNFSEINKKMYRNANISQYGNARIFAGYGVYDVEEKNCVFIDAVSSDGSTVDSQFTDFKVWNDHTYGISINNMTYDQCKIETLKYNGYPASIDTSEENNAIHTFYEEDNRWLGVERNGPCPSMYTDANGKELNFNGYIDTAAVCKNDKPYTMLREGSRFWKEGGSSEPGKCIIEINSIDKDKSLKNCAPWWDIERTFLLPTESRYSVDSVDAQGNPIKLDIRNFNQKDFPRSMNVCTQIDSASLPSGPAETHNVICNSYYDRTASPRCIENPQQSLCKVDGCRGAIKERCMLVSSDPAPLEYSKEPAFVDGSYTMIMKKVDIMMHKYSCPTQSREPTCLSNEDVTMLPQPCPGTGVDANGTTQKPIKVYGSTNYSGPDQYDASGNLKNLYGKCPDGTLIPVPINTLSQNSRECVNYSTIEESIEYDKMCVVERSYVDHEVNASITEEDEFADEETCVRINNVNEARPRQDVRIDYKTEGMANISIVKAYPYGNQERAFETTIPSTYYQEQMGNMAYSTDGFVVDAQNDTDIVALTQAMDIKGVPEINCAGLNASTYVSKLQEYQAHDLYDVTDYSRGIIVHYGRKTYDECVEANDGYSSTILVGAEDNNTALLNSLNYRYERDYDFISLIGERADDLIYYVPPPPEPDPEDLIDENGDPIDPPPPPPPLVMACYGVKQTSKVSGDLYKSVDFISPHSNEAGFIVETTSAVNYDRCREMAVCTNGDILNRSKYNGYQNCKLRWTNSSGEAIRNEILADIKAQMAPILAQLAANKDNSEALLDVNSQTGTLAIDQIDGLADIYAIIEHTDFDFGYFSSYSHLNFRPNTVYVNGVKAHPIVGHPRINEKIYEDYYWDYYKYRNYDLSSFLKMSIGSGEGGGLHITQDTLMVNQLTATGAASLTAIYNALFGKQIVTYEGYQESEIYNFIDSDYKLVQNPYGYETRLFYTEPGDSRLRVKYHEMNMTTENKQNISSEWMWMRQWQDDKERVYKELNINMGGYPWPAHDTKVQTPNPSRCKWYNPWCRKTNHASSDSTLDARYHNRTLSVHYMGATNTVTLVVPYKGDYNMTAYNSIGGKIGDFTIYEDAFIAMSEPDPDSENTAVMSYVQAKFGEVMDISPNVGGNPCVTDLMVEVGGGVSGAYYEHGDTGTFKNHTCAKSDDFYVQDNAIAQIRIRSAGQVEPFVVNLKKPMPYANRIFVQTLGLDENRLYRCFHGYGSCSDFERIEE